MKCELLVTTPSGQVVAGTITLLGDQLSVDSKDGYSRLVKNILTTSVWSDDVRISATNNPQEWIKALPKMFNGSYMRAKMVDDPTDVNRYTTTPKNLVVPARVKLVTVAKYSEDQARDDHGRFSGDAVHGQSDTKDNEDWARAKRNLGLPPDAPYSSAISAEATRLKSERTKKVMIAKAHKIKIDPDYKHPVLTVAQSKLQNTISSTFKKQQGRLIAIIRKHINKLKPLRVKKSRKIFKADESSFLDALIQRYLNLAPARYNALPSPLQTGLLSEASTQTPLTDDQLLELLKQAEDNADAMRDVLKEVGETEDAELSSQSGAEQLNDAQNALESAASVGADKGITELNITNNDVIASADAASQAWAQDRAAEMVGMKWVDGELVDNPNAKWVISDTTRSDINRIVTDAFSKPTSIQDVTQAIQDAGTFSDERAANIARTEIGNAQVQANFLAWQEAGNIAKLNFLTTNESDVCEVCLDFEDDNPYDFSEAPIPIEDTHPSCRCILVPVFGDGQEEE
jgi:hypothetical protein